MKKNINAHKSIINGILFSVPIGLICGLPGAIFSICNGLVSANNHYTKQRNGDKYVKSYSSKGTSKYANLKYNDLKEIIRTELSDLIIPDKSHNSFVIGKDLPPCLFMIKHDELKNNDDFRHVCFEITNNIYQIGFYSNGNYYFLNKELSSLIRFDIKERYNKYCKH